MSSQRSTTLKLAAQTALTSTIAFENLDHEVNIIPVNRMVEGRFRQVMRQIPAGGPAMEIGDLIGVAAVKLLVQKVGKEPVIAKPLSAVVQRHEEQILSFQRFPASPVRLLSR